MRVLLKISERFFFYGNVRLNVWIQLIKKKKSIFRPSKEGIEVTLIHCRPYLAAGHLAKALFTTLRDFARVMLTIINPLHPNISIHSLHTLLSTFPLV